jgi:hypothetical protein
MGVIMSKEVRIYFGKKFYQQKDGYWANMMPIQAHRWVWINHYGSIPKGMDIHHKDGNKSNNEIENLEMLSRSDHLKRHWQEGRFDLEKRRIQLKEARKWLQTEEGRKKQSEISKKSWRKRKRVIVKCLDCGEERETTQSWSKFCNYKCEKRYRRKKGVDKVEANCALCYKQFLKDKYSPQKFCSISCGAKNSAQHRPKPAS